MVRQALLDVGQRIASKDGLRALHLAELTAGVGISKPYFYTLFDSLEDFCLQLMEEQRIRLEQLLIRTLAQSGLSWEERVEAFLRVILDHRENGIIVMTQQEEAALHGSRSKITSLIVGWREGNDPSVAVVPTVPDLSGCGEAEICPAPL